LPYFWKRGGRRRTRIKKEKEEEKKEGEKEKEVVHKMFRDGAFFLESDGSLCLTQISKPEAF
jgi:hypothetical protein